eukprot:TRINITY_DN9160_c0_g1_i1.p1 TRINITY_DN9160_c0_g1~~TRINITY_DN9160_c0_g1_i1.p1  ORF type:complete len:402 (-),score=91.65 TRINITY_DN9160_c0_g1_i1:187-1392(-)
MSHRNSPSALPGRARPSEMIQGTQFVWCESCDDLSSALYQVESGQLDKAPNREEAFTEPLAKTAETYDKIVQSAKSLRMLLFNDLDEVSYAEYEAAMRDFIKSTNPKRWSEVEKAFSDEDGTNQSVQPALGMRLKKENSDVQWKLARTIALKKMHRTRSNLFTISAAMRNIFYWQQRVMQCTESKRAQGNELSPGAQGEDSHSGELDVFLGGSCNPTTWRKDIAIPMCQASRLSYYNPQVDDWHEGLVQIEAAAKENAKVLMFVVDNATRALASCLEATEHICVGRVVSLVVMSDLEEGCVIDGEAVGGKELKDLNRARSYLKDVAHRHGCVVHGDVRSGMQYVQELFQENVDEAELPDCPADLITACECELADEGQPGAMIDRIHALVTQNLERAERAAK